MNSLGMGLVSVAFVFGGAVLGQFIKSRLPDGHLCDESRETVKVGAGMLATLSALVLGLLIGSAKTSFDTANGVIILRGARVIHMDSLFERYGPEASEARKQLRVAVEEMLDTMWPEERAGDSGRSSASNFEGVDGLGKVQDIIHGMKPQTDVQRLLLSRAEQMNSELLQARWVLVEEARQTLPTPFLVVLVSWLALLFVSFGLFAPRNLTVMTVLFVSSVSVSAAIFLILEMNGPLEGLIKVSSAPLRNALTHLMQ